MEEFFLDQSLIKGIAPTPDQLHAIKSLEKELSTTEEVKRNEPLAQKYLTDAVLHRFLTATKYDNSKAKERLIQHVVWRYEKALPFNIKRNEIRELNKHGGVQVNPRGPDKHGRPILMFDRFRINKSNSQTSVESEALKLLTYSVETAIKLFTEEAKKFIVFINLEGFSVFNKSPKEESRGIIDLFQVQYPETLGLCILFGAPWLFSKFFEMIKYFIDETPRKKILFVPSTVEVGTPLDQKLNLNVGENWRLLFGIGLSKETKHSSPGYEHEKYMLKLKEIEEKIEI